MKAIVLSGGGSKGSYQIGVWKALRRLNIKYDLVTGTSVGALNGALMVQNNYFKAIKLWKHINMKLLFGDDATESNNTKDIIKMYRVNFFKNGGMDVKILENIIDKYIDNTSFYESDINFGLVTVNISGKKVIEIEKDNIERDKLIDYLMASASCYPAFQVKDIDGKKFIDGGVFDNLPINMAIKMGADSIIAIDLCAPGFKQKPIKKVNTITIKPNNKLTNFLNFNEIGSKRNIKFGYNDTMKVFGKFLGKKFTFKKRNYNRIMKEYNELFLYKFNDILNTKKLASILKIDNLKIDNTLLKNIEELGLLFELDETRIYNFKRFNKLILKKFKKYNSNNKLDQSIIKDNIYKLYNKMKNNDYKYLRLKGIFMPKEFIMALMLYIISEV